MQFTSTGNVIIRARDNTFTSKVCTHIVRCFARSYEKDSVITTTVNVVEPGSFVTSNPDNHEEDSSETKHGLKMYKRMKIIISVIAGSVLLIIIVIAIRRYKRKPIASSYSENDDSIYEYKTEEKPPKSK